MGVTFLRQLCSCEELVVSSRKVYSDPSPHHPGRSEAAGSSALDALVVAPDGGSASLSPVLGSRGRGPGLDSQGLSLVLLFIS